MKRDEQRTNEARQRHQDGVNALDRLFNYERGRDAKGLVLVDELRSLRFWRRVKKENTNA